MLKTPTQICNLALSHLAENAKQLTDLDAATGPLATAMRNYYEIARQEMLSEYQWSFAVHQATLTALETNPSTEWAYAYQYPSDCLKALRILSGFRVDTNDTKIPFKIGKGAAPVSGDVIRVIFTDQPDAVLEYQAVPVDADTPDYPPAFVLALSFYVAFLAASSVVGAAEDGRAARNDMFALYRHHVAIAKQNDANEQVPDPESDPENIEARG